jgi:leader peptidase (prepilin peptidase)/N-methyltransferase
MDPQSLAQLFNWAGSLPAILLGLAIGSFVNVVIYRVPRHQSVITPGSRCTHCDAALHPHDNIPIVSYLLLRGKCRACGAPISWQYPVVEIIVGLLFWLVWLKDGMSWSLVFDWAFVAACAALAGIDLTHRILPDVITYPGFVLAVGVRGLLPQQADAPRGSWSEPALLALGAGLIAGSSLIILGIEWLDLYLIGAGPSDDSHDSASQEIQTDDHSITDPAASEESGESSSVGDEYGRHLPLITIVLGLVMAGIFLLKVIVASPPHRMIDVHVRSIVGALFGAGIGGGILWLMRLLYHALRKIEGVGFGDIKMMMMVGAYLGGPLAFLAIFWSSILGSVVGLLVVIKQRSRGAKIPYGLFLAMGAVLALLVGGGLIDWYWDFYQLP